VGLAALALVGTFAFAAPGSATKAPKQFGLSTAPCNDGDVTASPAIIWPPNHKLIPVDVTYAETQSDGTTGDGDNDQIAITDITISPLSCRSDNSARLAGQILQAVQAARRESVRTRWACLDGITFAGRPVRNLLP